MEEFLKKFSNVPTQFITEFFEISKETYDNGVLVIDFDKVVKWLGTQKSNLKRLLINNFKEEYHYTIDNNNIMITPDCFKEICMISQTEKAKDFRKYFLSIEKLTRKYYTQIQEALNEQLGIKQKPKINNNGGIIYILQAQNANVTLLNVAKVLYKPGKMENNIKRINTNDILPLFIIKVDDVNAVEYCIKALIKRTEYKKHKEIYQIDLDILKDVCVLCDAIIDSFNAYIKNNKKQEIKKKFKTLHKGEHGLFIMFDKQ